jgi:hypothetical protein
MKAYTAYYDCTVKCAEFIKKLSSSLMTKFLFCPDIVEKLASECVNIDLHMYWTLATAPALQNSTSVYGLQDTIT